MPRAISLANGNMLVALDSRGRVRDLYYPTIGLENHIAQHDTHRVGFWVDGRFSWLESSEWSITVNCLPGALSGVTTAVNHNLGIEVELRDTVYNEKNIFLRHVSITNQTDFSKSVKVYFAQEFEIYHSHMADTAYFDPRHDVILHYKNRRAFLINLIKDKKGFTQYSTGVSGIEGKAGTFKDAEDGELSRNPIEHGPADSVIGIELEIEPSKTQSVDYFICVGKSIEETFELNKYVLKKTPKHLHETAADYWHAWAMKEDFNFTNLPGSAVALFRKSLLYTRAHVDNNGAIIASSDTDMLNGGKDTYAYMWPRDGAFAALALGQSGDTSAAQRFFEFCNDVITEDGYLMHKYGPDKSLGSSWHPWVKNGNMILPIQEDETASVIWSLWKHYSISRDLEFIEKVYNNLIKRSAIFMINYRDPSTKLCGPSYDLWEEKYGIHTYTAASVFGALKAAANFAKLLGKRDDFNEFNKEAEIISDAIMRHLYDESTGHFFKMIQVVDDQVMGVDKTVDSSSAYGIYLFGVLELSDQRLQQAMKLTEEVLTLPGDIGGVARYVNDNYYRQDRNTIGNPWYISTLWFAHYAIDTAANESELQASVKYLNWAARYTMPSGVMPEQVDPRNGKAVSAAPLTWSHSEYVRTILKYLDASERLGLCDDCNPVS